MTTLDLFLGLWALVIPITSVVLIPAVKGTTPGYILSLLSMVLAPLLSPRRRGRYLALMACAAGVFVFLNAAAQLGLSLSWGLDLSRLTLVDPFDDRLLLRGTMFTQSLYLLACLAAFVYVSVFYKSDKHDKYIFAGITLLAAYGIYELVFYLVFQHSGDFLSNRTFGHGDRVVSGSRFQLITIGGITVERLKSLTAEPSMYALTALPYFIYAVHTNRKTISVVLLATLLMSTSTTAILGLVVYLLVRLRYYGIKDRALLIGLPILALGALIGGSLLYDVYNKLIVAKVNLSSVSGIIRFGNFQDHLDFFLSAPWSVKLFGLGFGYVRSEDMLSTLLVNNGLAGLCVFTALFAYPVLKLGRSSRDIGLKAALVVTYLIMMTSVSEFAYQSIWLFLGMAYSGIGRKKSEGGI